jgi:hypothetical protein
MRSRTTPSRAMLWSSCKNATVGNEYVPDLGRPTGTARRLDPARGMEAQMNSEESVQRPKIVVTPIALYLLTLVGCLLLSALTSASYAMKSKYGCNLDRSGCNATCRTVHAGYDWTIQNCIKKCDNAFWDCIAGIVNQESPNGPGTGKPPKSSVTPGSAGPKVKSN